MQQQKKRSAKTAQSLRRATVVEILKSGEILVDLAGKTRRRMLCDFLQSASNNQLRLRKGIEVLVHPAATPNEKGCVIGRIGGYTEPETKKVELCAQEEITIRCGEGFITIRESGQVLIKGLDVVSHAQRNNRVRGGSIQLN